MERRKLIPLGLFTPTIIRARILMRISAVKIIPKVSVILRRENNGNFRIYKRFEDGFMEWVGMIGSFDPAWETLLRKVFQS